MSDDSARERMLELLADRAMVGLSEAEAFELKELGVRFPDLADDASFEKAAAVYSLSTLGVTEEVPGSLRSRLEADAFEFMAEKRSVEERSRSSEEQAPVVSVGFEKPGFSLGRWLGWGFAAVACLLLAVNVWTTRFVPSSDMAAVPAPQPTTELSAAEKLRLLAASADDLVRTKWASPTEEGTVAGEVVWSDDKQAGYMTFKGLEANDASKEQYQLWIFDETQDEATPIDGGVFDVTADGEVTVPIDAKLAVKNPTMFAVTVERPGGVVVSKREKIVAIAKV